MSAAPSMPSVQTPQSPAAHGAKLSSTPRWGMVIDLNRCVGCQTCTIACKHANDTQPGVQWRRVIDVEFGTFPDVERVFMVVGCQHCAEPPCVPVCPTGATRRRDDGLVTMNYDQCIGCASCAVACPYQARTIAHGHSWYYGVETAQENHSRHREREGVAQKCTFCIDKIDQAMDRDLTPGTDWDVTPACAASCIAQAIHFGNLNDPASNISQLVRDEPSFRMHEELGADPQIRYLYSTPAVPGRDLMPEDLGDGRLDDPENALVGKRQQFWDWRAALNWCLGGLSSGAVAMLWLWSLYTPIVPASHAALNFLFAILMVVGLFFVFLKIARKSRFWRAILRPQTSWMSRELWAVLLFGSATLISLVWPHGFFFAWAGVAALFFLVCQAKILQTARGIPNWRLPLVPWIVIATGLLEGTSLLGLIAASQLPAPFMGGRDTVGLVLPIAGVVIVLLNAGLWTGYRMTARAAGIGPLSRAVIAKASLSLDLVGHGLPLLMFLLAFYMPGSAAAFLVIGGVAAIVGGIFKKFTLIVRAGYQQGYALAMLPQRGSGTKAASGLSNIKSSPASTRVYAASGF